MVLIVVTPFVPRGQGQAALLAPPKTLTLRAAEIRSEKERSFDLLDALSCSGASKPGWTAVMRTAEVNRRDAYLTHRPALHAVRLEAASLHVVLAVTHAFDESLMDVVIGQNVNPIEKLERTSLILASAVQARRDGWLHHKPSTWHSHLTHRPRGRRSPPRGSCVRLRSRASPRTRHRRCCRHRMARTTTVRDC